MTPGLGRAVSPELTVLQLGDDALDMMPIHMLRTNFQPFARRKAFTLIELLVVIAIIGILAGLSLAVSGTVRKTMDRTKCLTNMRSIGGAISAHLADSGGVLPGPLWTWQSCWYDEQDFGAIGTILSPYLGHPARSEKQKMDVLLCPAWQRGAPYRDDQSWLMNTEVMVNGTALNPWGDADIAFENEGEPSGDPSAPDEPKRMVQLADISLVRVWAIQDLDSKSPVRKVPRGIAVTPVHGDKRNALFFDFHAESIPLNYVP